MTDLFSTPAEHAFEHEELGAIAGPSTMGDATDKLSIEQAFEVEDTIKRIRDGGYKTVRPTPNLLIPRAKSTDLVVKSDGEKG